MHVHHRHAELYKNDKIGNFFTDIKAAFTHFNGNVSKAEFKPTCTKRSLFS